MEKLIFATSNKAKLSQLKFVASRLGFNFEIVGIKEVFDGETVYEEVGSTVEEVAKNGAIALAQRVGKPVITEDSDFRVEALGGEPGIRAGEFLKKFGRTEILNRMRGVENRAAVIGSAVVFATPEGDVRVFSNYVKGQIANEEKFGDFPDWVAPNPELSFGGGYNAIFIPEGWGKTLAEISPEEAIPWSYREKNFIDLLNFLSKRNC